MMAQVPSPCAVKETVLFYYALSFPIFLFVQALFQEMSWHLMIRCTVAAGRLPCPFFPQDTQWGAAALTWALGPGQRQNYVWGLLLLWPEVRARRTLEQTPAHTSRW